MIINSADITVEAPQLELGGKRLTAQQQLFLSSEDGQQARQLLEMMLADPLFNTQDSFSIKDPLDHNFVSKHLLYLCEHPKLQVSHYLSNLRLKTRIAAR